MRLPDCPRSPVCKRSDGEPSRECGVCGPSARPAPAAGRSLPGRRLREPQGGSGQQEQPRTGAAPKRIRLRLSIRQQNLAAFRHLPPDRKGPSVRARAVRPPQGGGLREDLLGGHSPPRPELLKCHSLKRGFSRNYAYVFGTRGFLKPQPRNWQRLFCSFPGLMLTRRSVDAGDVPFSPGFSSHPWRQQADPDDFYFSSRERRLISSS